MADPIEGIAQGGSSILSKAWKAAKFALPVLAVSTVIAAATGGISLGLDAAAVTTAGNSIAATGAASVPITPSVIAGGVWDGLVHNVGHAADFLGTAFEGAQTAFEGAQTALDVPAVG